MASMKSEADLYSFLSPPLGIVGEGSLSTIFQHESRPVIVMDEIEKAHPVFISDMLLSLIDDSGSSIQDKKTHIRYDTSGAMFILTSNCFSDAMTDSNITIALQRNWFAESSANPGCNVLRRGDIYRRLVAGHVLARQTTPYILFTPPAIEDITPLVESIAAESPVKWTRDAKQQIVNRTIAKFYTKTSLLDQYWRSPTYVGFTGGYSVLQSFIKVQMMSAFDQGATLTTTTTTITYTDAGFVPVTVEYSYEYAYEYVWAVLFVLVIACLVYYYPMGAVLVGQTMLSMDTLSIGGSVAASLLSVYYKPIYYYYVIVGVVVIGVASCSCCFYPRLKR